MYSSCTHVHVVMKTIRQTKGQVSINLTTSNCPRDAMFTISQVMLTDNLALLITTSHTHDRNDMVHGVNAWACMAAWMDTL